jgi:hypothetical protein
MSEANKFDNFIKNELGNLSPEVSPEIWDRIVHEREKKRPGGFWLPVFSAKNALIILGVLVSIGVGTSLLIGKTNTKTFTATAHTGISKEEISATIPSETLSSKTGAVKEKLSDNDLVIKPANSVQKTDAIQKQDDPNTIAQKKTKNANSLSKYTKASYLIDMNLSGSDNNLVSTDPSTNLSTSSNKIFSDKVEIDPVIRATISDLKNKSVPKTYMPECPQIEKEAAANKKYVEFYAGPDIIFRNFSDTAKSTYLQKRKESTKVVSAYSVGVRYAKVFKNGMGIKTGINYSQINERFTFVQNNLVQVTYIIDPQTGDTTGSYTVNGSRKKVTNNRYRFIDVPLLIGYEFGNGRLHTNVSVGTMVNIYSWQRGDVLDSAYQPVNITTGKSSSPYQFKSNIGVALAGSVSLYYKVSDQVHLMLEPYFRYNLSPMSKDVLSFKQKYNTLGMHFGVRLDIP